MRCHAPVPAKLCGEPGGQRHKHLRQTGPNPAPRNQQVQLSDTRKVTGSQAEKRTFSTTYHSGARPRGLGGLQLSTTYDLKTSDACTSVGSPGTVTYPGSGSMGSGLGRRRRLQKPRPRAPYRSSRATRTLGSHRVGAGPGTSAEPPELWASSSC